ncbi:MAG: tetratricopeptide repeat protein [Planctomycetes bacterium]|nr:tetratricopeptide repeat protein [Planctomycetota bacterium]
MHAELAYLFRHALLRDAAYTLQMPGDRERLHASALAILETLSGGESPALSAADCCAEMAEHARLAGNLHAEQRHRQLAATMAAIRWRNQEETEHLLRLIEISEGPAAAHYHVRLCDKLRLMGRFDHAMQQARLAIDGLPPGDKQRSKAAALLGRMCGHTGNAEAGLPWLKQALADAEASGDVEQVAYAWNETGLLFSRLGRPADSEAAYARSRELSEAAGLLGALGDATSNLAAALYVKGDLTTAEALNRQALEIHRRTGHRVSEGVVLGNLASVLRMSGRAEEAERLFGQAIEIHRQVGDRFHEGLNSSNLGNLHRVAGNFEVARGLYLRARDIMREIGAVGMEGYALFQLAVVARELESPEAAEPFYEEAIGRLKRAGETRPLGMALAGLGSVRLDQDRVDEAIELFNQGIELSRKVGDAPSLSNSLHNLAGAQQRAGLHSAALATIDEALLLMQRIGDPVQVTMQRGTRAAILLLSGQSEPAASEWRGIEESLDQLSPNIRQGVVQSWRKACAETGFRP